MLLGWTCEAYARGPKRITRKTWAEYKSKEIANYTTPKH